MNKSTPFLNYRGIACGAGHFYALNFPKHAQLEEGVFVRFSIANNKYFSSYIAFFFHCARLSFCHYHTMEEVSTVLKALQDIARHNH